TREIIAHIGAGSGAVQRELKKLSDSRLVNVWSVGNQRHYQANNASPIFHELCAIVRKTVGLAAPLSQALKPLTQHILLAIVYGSIAKGSSTAASDVDLLVVSNKLTLNKLHAVLEKAERTLGRPIHPTLYTAQEFE